MKLLISSLWLLLSAVTANAQDSAVSTTFGYVDTQSYYACSYAQAQMNSYIRELGGEVKRIQCSGGLPYSEFLTVTATFIPGTESFSVRLRGRDACDFNKKLIDHLLPYFSPTNVVARDTCFHAQGWYDYTISL